VGRIESQRSSKSERQWLKRSSFPAPPPITARPWYEERSLQAAAGFEAAIDVALRRIAGSPRTWALCDDRHRLYTLRKYPYSIVYRQEGDDIVIVAVAHSSRSPYWQQRE
jgi:plasmid stabilization system protein ParE